MAGYKKPKAHVHREFVYLNYETVMNSLSALEAGKVDEIIEKTSEAREGGLAGSVAVGPIKGGGDKKKAVSIQEELVRSRTWFSAFEAWYNYLNSAGAFGELDSWDLETRNELSVGDTVKFASHISLAPLHKMFATFIAYANDAGQADSIFKVKREQVAEMRKVARQMAGWMRGPSDARNLFVYVKPLDVPEPRMVARLDERYIIGGVGSVDGHYTVIAQVESLLAEEERVSAIRVIRDVPPTPMETETIEKALENFIEVSAELGVVLKRDDISIPHPAVILHPIAIYR